MGAKNTVIRNNSFVNNDEYGGFALDSKRTKFLHNRARGSDEAGLYVGSSPNARAVLRGNRARRNGTFGFFLRDAAHGVVINNQVARNCMGIALVNTGEPGGVHHWKVRGNDVLKNQAQCPGGGGEPAITGTGIGLIGARGNLVRSNIVVGNRPADPVGVRPGGNRAGLVGALRGEPRREQQDPAELGLQERARRHRLGRRWTGQSVLPQPVRHLAARRPL